VSIHTDDDLSAVWAGRLELRLKPNTDEYAEGYRGAYTTVLVRCENVQQFITAVAEHVGREGFEISGIEQLFPLISGQFELNETIEELIDRIREYPVQWTTFHMFKDDA
jgi:hypothetical protein